MATPRKPGDRAIRIYPTQFLLAMYGLDEKALGYYIRLLALSESESLVPTAAARATADSPYLFNRYVRDLEEANLVAREATGVRLAEWGAATDKWRWFGCSNHRDPMAAVSRVPVPAGRIPLSRAIRDYVIDRDRRVCGICGEAVGLDQGLDIDHVIPLAHGGSDDLHNLQVAHATCNRSKGARILPAGDKA